MALAPVFLIVLVKPAVGMVAEAPAVIAPRANRVPRNWHFAALSRVALPNAGIWSAGLTAAVVLVARAGPVFPAKKDNALEQANACRIAIRGSVETTGVVVHAEAAHRG